MLQTEFSDFNEMFLILSNTFQFLQDEPKHVHSLRTIKTAKRELLEMNSSFELKGISIN